MAKKKKHVVVIGGGFAGRRVARLLNRRQFEVTLVDAKGYFEYTPSNLRCIVEPGHAAFTVFPQPRDTLIAYVKAIHPSKKGGGTVELTSRAGVASLEYDYCVVTAGSAYELPIKGDQIAPVTVEQRRADFEREHARAAAAQRIVVVGGGPVGVELAAEFAGHWGTSKQVTLVHGAPRLLERMPPKAGQAAAAWLRSHGVEVVLGERITDWGSVRSVASVANAVFASASAAGLTPGGRRAPLTRSTIKALEAEANGEAAPSAGDSILVTSSGRCIPADLVYRCCGAPPCTAHLEGLPLTASGHIQVEPTLQVVGLRNVFAAGDCCATAEVKDGLAADLNAGLVAANLERLAAGRRSSSSRDAAPALLRYPQDASHGAASRPAIAVISLHKYDGVMQFNRLVLTGWVAAAMKWYVETFQVLTARGWRAAAALWLLGEKAMVWSGRFLFR